MAATTGFSHRSSYTTNRTSNNNNYYYIEHGSNHVQSVGVKADHYPHHQIMGSRTFHHSQPPKGDQIGQRTTLKTTTPTATATPIPKSEAYVEAVELPVKDAGKLDHQKYKRPNVINHRDAVAKYGGKLVEISNVINHKEAAVKYGGKVM